MTHFEMLHRGAPDFATVLKAMCPAPDLEWQAEMFDDFFSSGNSAYAGFGADFLGSGAFKECYASIPGHVVKFISYPHVAEAEAGILELASREDLPPIFVPSLYGNLPRPVQATYVDIYDDYAGYYGETSDLFASFCVQPRCEKCDIEGENDDIIPWGEKEYKPELLPIHIPYTIIMVLEGVPYEWCAAAIKEYGEAGFIKFCGFCEQHGITDLRAANLGYLEGRPIVLDWLS